MVDKPEIAAWFVDAEIAEDDPLAAVKRRARQLCDPHYQAGQSAARLAPLVDALAVKSLDPMGLCDASGLDEPALDAATYVALTLEQVERDGP